MSTGCALFFDMDQAKREEKRSKLSKAFSSLFKRRTAKPVERDGWSEIDLRSVPDAEAFMKAVKPSKMKGLKQSCKNIISDIFNSRKPKTLQQTIPVQFKQARGMSEEISMSPIKSQAEITPRPPQKIVSKNDAVAFQKLALEQWSRDQARMAEGTFTFPPGFQPKYELSQVIGEGSFGFVMMAERKRDGKQVAVKWALREKIPPKQWIYNPERGLIPSEVHHLHSLSHSGIIQLLDYFDGGGDYVCMVTELHGTEWTWPNGKLSQKKNPGLRPPAQLEAMRGPVIPGRRSPCDLFECIEAHGHLPDQTIFTIFSQLLETVLYLRQAGLVHRDLKDENIVIDERYRIKLVDFGSCSEIPWEADGKEAMFKQFNGTIAFAAPEIIRGHWYYPTLAEVWTMGILLYTLAYKKAPFHTTDEILHLTPQELASTPNDEPSINCLLRQMLEKQAGQRIRLEAIKEHPWYRDCQDKYCTYK